MNRTHVLLLLPLALLLLAASSGCDDETGPLVRPQTLAGIVWDAAGDSVPGAQIGLVYNIAAPAVPPPSAERAEPAKQGPEPQLAQNYPNPFDWTTTFSFELPADARVRLDLLDLVGQETVLLLEADFTAGQHTFVWNNGAPGTGAVLANGYYVGRLQILSGDDVTATSVIYGVLCNVADPLLLSPNALTSSVGEFVIPFPEIASGIRIPRTAPDGPDIVDRIEVPFRLQVVARDGGLQTTKSVDLGDMTHWHYIEFRLPAP
jgi:hypothetical protein